MRHRLTLFLTLLLPLVVASPSHAQREDIHWFSDFYSIDFSGGVPLVKEDTTLIFNDPATYSDRQTGRLLFISDGFQCWNRDRQIMPHGGYLLSNLPYMVDYYNVASPVPGSSRKYYSFRTIAPPGSPKSMELVYSIIDMDRDSGRGDVVANNVPIASGMATSIGITPASNGCDVWVLCHSAFDPEFYAYLVTPAGVSGTPVISRVGNAGIWLGFMDFSLGGEWLGSVLGGVAELFHFDKLTGKVSHYLPIDSIRGEPGQPIAFAFSASGKRAYLTYTDDKNRANSHVVQYDLSVDDSVMIKKSAQIVGQLGPYKGAFFEMRYAIDGRIYVSRADLAAVISNPEGLGVACGFIDSVFPFGHGAPGFQTIIQSPANSPYHQGKCDSALMADFMSRPSVECNDLCIELSDKSTLSANSWRWIMPGAHLASSTSPHPTACYDTAGIYPVTLIASGVGGADTITKVVKISTASGLLQLVREADTMVKAGGVAQIPIKYLLPPSFDHTREFVRLSVGLSYNDALLKLPLAEAAARVRPDSGWMLLSIDSEAGLLRLEFGDTGYYSQTLGLSYTLRDSLLLIGTLDFTCTATRLDTATVKLAYCHLETNEESFAFCDNIEKNIIARVIIEGKRSVSAATRQSSEWRVMPNPISADELKIYPPSEAIGKATSLTLCDILGRELMRHHVARQGNLTEWSISTLPAGTYYLRIESDRNTPITRRVVVRR